MNIIEELGRNRDLFAGFSPSELEVLATAVTERHCAAGEAVCRTGEAGDSLLLVASGKLVVQRPVGEERVTLATLKPGQACGEMSLVDGSARNADVMAVEDSAVLEIARSGLETALAGHSDTSSRFWRNVATVLSARLRHTNDQVAEYVKINRRILEDDAFRRFYRTL
jgi:CRP-like cAMP-binding protein